MGENGPMSEHRDVELATEMEDANAPSGRSVIAAIGIDRYQSWQRLTNAVNDARGVLELFGRLGFEQVTEPLLDDAATGTAIQALVMDDLRTLGARDSLVLFYAGHGGTRTDQLGSHEVKTGYLIPIDASDKAATWIDLEGWLRAVARLPAKHILVILDACHSGIALGPIIKWRDTGTWRDTPLGTLKARRSRRIITSALDDQVALDSGPVYGHSLFTGCLIEGLTHGIGGGSSGVTTGSELGLYVQHRVIRYPWSRQTPDFGTFDFDDHGELVIPLVSERTENSTIASEPPTASPALGTAAFTANVGIVSALPRPDLLSIVRSVPTIQGRTRARRPVDPASALISNTMVCEVSRLVVTPADRQPHWEVRTRRAQDLFSLIEAVVLHEKLYTLPARPIHGVSELQLRAALIDAGVVCEFDTTGEHDEIARLLLEGITSVPAPPLP